MIKKPPGVLSLQNVYIISTCFAFVICFSPPGCPCQTNTAYKCPVLPKRDCEVVYDYCGCCPQCALALGERCQEFGTVCQTGLICLWDRFWYDEPLSGKCWYRGYARKILSNSSLAVGNKLNLSTAQPNTPKYVTAAVSAAASAASAAVSTAAIAAHNSSINIEPTVTITTTKTTNFSTTSAATTSFQRHFRKKPTAIHYRPSKWAYLVRRIGPKEDLN